jgi:hypothetical protein
MRRAPAILALALASALPLSASETVRHFGQQLDAAGADRIAIDLPVGEATITGWDRDRVASTSSLCRHETDAAVAAAKATIHHRTSGAPRIEPELAFARRQGAADGAKISVPRDHARLGPALGGVSSASGIGPIYAATRSRRDEHPPPLPFGASTTASASRRWSPEGTGSSAAG